MDIKVLTGIVLIKIALVLSKDAELPLCPTNISYFPQNLPMHCRMPSGADFHGFPGALPNVAQGNQNLPSAKQPPLPMPIPFPPGIPGPMPVPGSMQIPGPIPGQMAMPGPVAMPGSMGPSGPIPFGGPMPLSPGPSHKLPVIVMPFYSPDTSFKNPGRPNHPQHNLRPGKRKIRHRRRRPGHYPRDTSSSDDTDTSSEALSSSSSEYQGWWKGKRNNRRSNLPSRKKKRHYQQRQLLTPVLQYVTKDGYVIFEKKISKTEAKDWLHVKNDEKMGFNTRISPEAKDMESNEQREDHTAEKEPITGENIEVVTKRNSHQHNRIKVVGEKTAKRKHGSHPR